VIRIFLEPTFSSKSIAFTCYYTPIEVVPLRLDKDSPASMPLLKAFAEVLCLEHAKHNPSLFLNHHNVIKSSSLQCQIKFWKKLQGARYREQ
jgi:hypothetical protein